ncbi:hypothetical protein FLK61_35235 [Paenalkalicoccus suaedae]|uniref:Uncharacterized protein n=1 Tax=Paenalkalicoccus suaedae TaxID=2592382 RepID=A0A859FGZ3_9BACI|nr:hypothetical protein [Paenalkalicoccus suaedae]QKS71924.1 hypothetical protein FLK61_35235 [Paenalkalicoccus suaedae]
MVFGLIRMCKRIRNASILAGDIKAARRGAGHLGKRVASRKVKGPYKYLVK